MQVTSKKVEYCKVEKIQRKVQFALKFDRKTKGGGRYRRISFIRKIHWALAEKGKLRKSCKQLLRRICQWEKKSERLRKEIGVRKWIY